MDPEQPLLPRYPTVCGAVDHRGRPAPRDSTGGWSAALFIIGVELAERFAFYGMSTNLITYLTGTLGESTASAAANVNAWSGAVSMLPLLGGILADSWLGRYKTIIGASLLYVLGLGLLTLSAIAPGLRPECNSDGTCSATVFQVAFFFCSLYLVSFAQGGHKPCVQAFGADQFDENDPVECKSKSSFFNWWYFGMCCGTVVALITLSYVQDNISWGLGFGIPCAAMVLALVVFLVGRTSYRYQIHPRGKGDDQAEGSERSTAMEGDDTLGGNYRSKKEIVMENGPHKENFIVALSKLFPIWATCLVYAIVYAQATTFFTKQGSTLERHIGPTFQVPPAALLTFISISIMAIIPMYDRILVPATRAITGLPSGITMLQRIGIGMFISVLSMVIAALVEMRRLKIAKDYGLVDVASATIPMTLWWLVPQYVLFGVADVFTMVGLQEFFYDQVPGGLRSLGMALYLSIFGIGSFLSSFLVSFIDKASRECGESWFADNLNRGHLDYFYFLLAGLSAIQLLVFLFFSRVYIYKESAT